MTTLYKGMVKLFNIFILAAILGLLACDSGVGFLAEGDKAPDFTLPDLDGNPVSLNSLLQGKKEVLLNFWASWCPDCRREIPRLNEFAEKYKDKVEIVGINLKESKETTGSFTNAYGIGYRILLDGEGETARLYGIIGVPTNVLISRDGLIKKLNLDIREMESYFAKGALK